MNYWCGNTTDIKVTDIPILVYNVRFCRRLKNEKPASNLSSYNRTKFI